MINFNHSRSATEIQAICGNCGTSFTPRKCSGGSPQRFCSPACRQGFHVGKVPSVASVGVPSVVTSISASVVPSVSDAGPDADDADTDFCWSDEDTLIRTQPATAVYINPYGEIVIRQQDYHGPYEDDDKVILIDRKYLPLLIRRLQEIADTGP